MPAYPDSIGKVKNYFKELDKDILYFSPLFLRTLKCNINCGACCPKFSLDYLDGSERWNKFKELFPEKVHLFKKRMVDKATYWTYSQKGVDDRFCSFLEKKTALCGIHEANPFSCDFEIIKLQGQGSYSRYGILLTQLIKKEFGRKWAMTKVDGTKGTKCEIKGFDEDTFKRDIELLEELQSLYFAHYEVKNIKLGHLIKYLKENFQDICKNPDMALFIVDEGFITREQVLERKTVERWW